MVAVPAVGRTRLSSMRSVVVLPAPFGPRNPVTRPGSTANDRLSTALTRLYCLVRPETTICPSDIDLLPGGGADAPPVNSASPGQPDLCRGVCLGLRHDTVRGGPAQCRPVR